MEMKVELLYFDGCPHYEPLLVRLRELIGREGIDAEVELRRVATPEAAERERFLGSPTVRIDSCDVEPDCGDRDDFGLTCRLYRSEEGTSGTPPERWITAALRSGASRAR